MSSSAVSQASRFRQRRRRLSPRMGKRKEISWPHSTGPLRSAGGSGAFTVPPEMAAHIRGAEVILGQATVPRCHCASISYGDTMEITFAGTQAETDTEREFFRFLVREGIPVRVESNR